jgi:hypothetical protein
MTPPPTRLVLSPMLLEGLKRLQKLMNLRSPSAAAEYLILTYLDQETRIQQQIYDQAQAVREGRG